MNSGMLWFDNNKQTALSSKVDQAAQYYKKKYGQMPDLCYIHPQMIIEAETLATKPELKTSPSILLHHFWLGTQKTAEEDQ